MIFDVEVVVTNKKRARDPEGETIHKHLVLKSGYDQVLGVRAGRYFLFKVEAGSPEEALKLVEEIVRRLRVYNPVVHDAEVRLRG